MLSGVTESVGLEIRRVWKGGQNKDVLIVTLLVDAEASECLTRKLVRLQLRSYRGRTSHGLILRSLNIYR
jgi:hypothetical protein